MRLSTWVQFTWNLKELPAEVAKLAPRYKVEPATLEDRTPLFAAINLSLSMEPAWSDDLAARVRLADELLHAGFSSGEVSFLAIKHGARVIGAAAIREGTEKSNLPLGVCVVSEYRNRGLGTYLLHESLRRLKEKGLEEAKLVTKKGLPADRFLYPKFGATRIVLSGVPV